jgi:hypothetical protein
MASRHGTLVANTEVTHTLTGPDGLPAVVEVLNRDGVAEIFFTVDGTAAVVGGNDTECLPATIGSVERALPPAAGPRTVTVRVISPGAPKYTVRVG